MAALAAARTAYEAGDFIAALTHLSGLIDGSEDQDTLLLLAETFDKLGLTADAAEIASRAAESDDPSPQVLKRAVELHDKIGDEARIQLYGMRLFEKAPDDADNAALLAASFLRGGEDAFARLLRAPLAESERPDHLMIAGTLYNDEERDPAALTVFRKIAALHPDDPFAQLKLLAVARNFCDYALIETVEEKLKPALRARDAAVFEGETGYSNLLWCADEAVNRLATNNPCSRPMPSPASIAARRTRPHAWTARLRVGYLSSDLWDDHATMRLLQSVLEQHDLGRVEPVLYCYTPERFVGFDAGGRDRWGKIVPIGTMSDAEAAETIRRDGIDILVDLKGFTGGSRSGILNVGPAPVQVAWLGFPGSTVGVDLDYVIGDPIVLPPSSQPHYHEQICRLPESYQPNDPVHRVLPPATPRDDLGLPADRFVFASFNTQRKISLQTLETWAEILRGAPRSVLWVMIDGALARENVLAALERRGVAAERVHFAPKCDYATHIARLQAADLGLDTAPYNGHTTTSDKLWAGLPVITQKGSNFASRVSESLLTAIGLPDLVLPNRQALVARAIALAEDPAAIARTKTRLAENRFRAPLFDAERFCRHLEQAFETMAARAKAKKPPIKWPSQLIVSVCGEGSYH